MIASTSISTFHCGSSSAATTTVVLAGRTRAEDLAVHRRDRREVGGVDEVHAGAHDVGEGRAGVLERLADDLEAPARLRRGVGVDGAVGPLRRGAGHHHPVADPHGPAVADGQLVGRPRGDELPPVHRRQRYRWPRRRRSTNHRAVTLYARWRDVAADATHRLWRGLQWAGAVGPQDRVARRYHHFGDGTLHGVPARRRVRRGAHLASATATLIAAHVSLSVGMAPGQPLPPGATSPVLRIGDRCSIGRASHIVAHRSVVHRRRRHHRPALLHHRPEPRVRRPRRADRPAVAHRRPGGDRRRLVARRRRDRAARHAPRPQHRRRRRRRWCAASSPTTPCSSGRRPRSCAATRPGEGWQPALRDVHIDPPEGWSPRSG